jgi:hypothetical protein
LAGANEWIGGVVRARPRCTRRSRKSPFQATGMFFHGSNPRLWASLAMPSSSTRSRPALCPRPGSFVAHAVARAIARAKEPAWATSRRVGVALQRQPHGGLGRPPQKQPRGGSGRPPQLGCSTSHLRTDGLEGATRGRFCKRECRSATISGLSVPGRVYALAFQSRFLGVLCRFGDAICERRGNCIRLYPGTRARSASPGERGEAERPRTLVAPSQP